jgi:hypothetical protein
VKVSWDDHSQYDGKVIKFHGSSHHQPVVWSLDDDLASPASRRTFQVYLDLDAKALCVVLQGPSPPSLTRNDAVQREVLVNVTLLAPGCGSYGNGMVIQYGDFIGFHDDLMVI